MEIKNTKQIKQVGAGAGILTAVSLALPVSSSNMAEFSLNFQNPINNALVQPVCAKRKCGECTITPNIPGIFGTHKGKSVCVKCDVDIRTVIQNNNNQQQFNPKQKNLNLLEEKK